MDVGDEYFRVILVWIEKPVAVMDVDVDVRDFPDTVFFTQRIDHHTAVVEHAEARAIVAPCVVQAADRLKRAIDVAAHHALEAFERRTDYRRGRVVDAGISGRVSVIDRAYAQFAQPVDALHVTRAVKTLDFVARGGTRRGEFRGFVEALLDGLFPERILAIRAERVPVRKSILAERLTDVEQYICSHAGLRFPLPSSAWRRSL